MDRRLVVRVVHGRPCVTDRARPGAPVVDVDVDGRPVSAAAHLCGWLPGAAADAPWPTPAAARDALAAVDDWPAVAELAGPEPAALPPAEEAALLALRHRHPGAFIEGPHGDAGGWAVVVSGGSALGWLVGRGATPRDAARDALDQAARRARGPGAGRLTPPAP